MEQENKNNTALKAGLILALALAALFGFLYFNSRQEVDQKNVDISAKTKELLITNSKLDSIGTQLDAKIAEIKSLGGQVEELEKLKAQLEEDKKSLANSKTVSIKQFQDKIKGYESVLKQKEEELVKLREENAVLTTQNKTLNTENTGLKDENTGLRTVKTQLTDSVYSVSKKNVELSEKVTLAAALKATNVNITAYNSRGKEFQGGDYKAKWIDKVKVFMKLAENPLTKKEQKMVYLRMLDPNGNVISDMATGSGTFQFGGKETVYSTKQAVDYENNGQVVDMFYQRGAPYEKGKYTIELFSEGFRIGQGTFDVK